MLGVTPDNDLVAIKELRSRAVPSMFAKELQDWYKGHRVTDIVCDSFGSSELTGGDGNLSFIQVLKNNGVRIRATSYDEKQDEAWVQMIQEVLAVPAEADNFGRREPRLKVFNDLRVLIDDIETVEWQTYRNLEEFKPKLAIESKDLLACLKYALAAQPRWNRGHERVLGARRGSYNWQQRDRYKIGR
jgi:hypothetical protein